MVVSIGTHPKLVDKSIKKINIKSMPAKSKAQQRIMGMAMAMKEGKMAHSKSPAAHKIAKHMTKEEIKKFAGTKTKGLPEYKSKKKRMITDEGGYMMA